MRLGYRRVEPGKDETPSIRAFRLEPRPLLGPLHLFQVVDDLERCFDELVGLGHHGITLGSFTSLVHVHHALAVGYAGEGGLGVLEHHAAVIHRGSKGSGDELWCI